jgi:hypothetical protein
MDTQPVTENKEPKIENQKFESPKAEPVKTEVVREIHHHHNDRGRGPGGMFIGLIVVAIGVYFLGKQAGWFPEDVEINWNWIWPLFIIAIGVSMLSRRGIFGWLLTTIMTIGVIGFLAAAAFGAFGKSEPLQTDTVSIAKAADVKALALSIDTGAGNLTVSGGSDQLITGTHTHYGMQLEQTSVVENGTQRVQLKTTKDWGWIGRHRNDLTLQLANDVPTQLTVASGAMDMTLDLTSVQATNIDVSTGASDLTLTLGDKADSAKVHVGAGASSITVNLPKTLGARLIWSAGASSKTLPDFNKIDDKTYETSNYASASKKVDLDFDLGAASLTVNWR